MKKKTFFKHALLFSAVYFFSLNGVGALPNLSVVFLLKEKIGLNPSQTAYFQAVTLMAWVIKPLWGYLSDAFPLWGYRRKSYLLLTSGLAAGAWIWLALLPQYSVASLLMLITLAYCAYAFQDVVTDGFMVEVGQPENLTGRFQSAQWSAVYLAMILTSLAGGWMAEGTRNGSISFQIVFSLAAVSPLIIFLMSLFLVSEKRYGFIQGVSEKISWKKLLENKQVWLLAVFLFLWTFSPSVGTPFMYYAVDTLKFDGPFLGILQALASLTAFVTSLFFSKWIDRLPLRRFLIGIVFTGIVMMLSHLVYFLPFITAHPEWARGIAIATRIPFAVFDTLVVLTLMNLAAKISPQYAGGSVFALLMSFYNLGQVGADILGGIFFGLVGLQGLIVISALFSLFTLLVLPYLSIPEDRTRLEMLVLRVLPFKL